MKVPKDFSLYTEDGWVNIPAISRLPAWLIVIIGKRQVGKTFGILSHLIGEHKHFMYWRRSEDELEFISKNPEYNPFRAMQYHGWDIDIVRNGKHDYRIGWVDTRNEKGQPTEMREIAPGVDILTISKLRGFDGSAFTDIFFDEFIPERIVVQRKAEGDGVVSGYTTVCGNRELEGKPPLRMWMAANTNRINSPVLIAWGLLPLVEQLMRSKREYLLTDEGVFIAMPQSQVITEKRAKTAAMRHLAKTDGAYYGMAMRNEFSYDSLQFVRPQSIRGMIPIMAAGGLYFYQNAGSLYVCSIRHNKRPAYQDTPEDAIRCEMDYPELRILYNSGKIYFESASSLLKYREYFGIKD